MQQDQLFTVMANSFASLIFSYSQENRWKDELFLVRPRVDYGCTYITYSSSNMIIVACQQTKINRYQWEQQEGSLINITVDETIMIVGNSVIIGSLDRCDTLRSLCRTILTIKLLYDCRCICNRCNISQIISELLFHVGQKWLDIIQVIWSLVGNGLCCKLMTKSPHFSIKIPCFFFI